VNRALVVAKRDFENARRSYLLAGVIGVFSLLVFLVTALPGLLSDSPIGGRAAVVLITFPAGVLIPVTAVIASYLAIAGERESGSLKILLSLPPSRRDVVLGKFLGRTAVVGVAIAIAFAIGALVAALVYGSLPVGPYLLTAALTALLGVSFVGLSVGLSAATSTRTRAMAPAVGAVIILGPLWQGIVVAIRFVADLGFSVELAEETVTLLTVLSPASAYGRLFNSAVLPDLLGGLAQSGIAGSQPVSTVGAPVYLQDWFVLLLMVAWVVVPVLLGYWRFSGADIS
jgi:ABC-2 type transport system permease protein